MEVIEFCVRSLAQINTWLNTAPTYNTMILRLFLIATIPVFISEVIFGLYNKYSIKETCIYSILGIISFWILPSSLIFLFLLFQ